MTVSTNQNLLLMLRSSSYFSSLLFAVILMFAKAAFRTKNPLMLVARQ